MFVSLFSVILFLVGNGNIEIDENLNSEGTGYQVSAGIENYIDRKLERGDSGNSTRETSIQNLSDYSQWLVNVQNGAQFGLCFDPEAGSVRSISSRPDAESEWETLGNYATTLVCEPGEQQAQITEEEIYRAAAELLVHPDGPQVQPPLGSLVLVNAPLVVFVDPSMQHVTTRMHGITIQIEATPVLYEWDFGDGSKPLLTSDPGRAYPNHTLSHNYTKEGRYQLSLTTAWQGRWQVNSGGWHTFTHRVITKADVGTIEPQSVRARLVEPQR